MLDKRSTELHADFLYPCLTCQFPGHHIPEQRGRVGGREDSAAQCSGEREREGMKREGGRGGGGGGEGTLRPHLLQVRVQLFQHHLQLVHLARQIQR